MKVHYDNEVDAIYIKLGNQKPDGVIEISQGVNLDTTSDNKIESTGLITDGCRIIQVVTTTVRISKEINPLP